MRLTVSEFIKEMKKFANMKNDEQRDKYEELRDLYTLIYERQRIKDKDALQCTLHNGELHAPIAFESGIMFYILHNVSALDLFSESPENKHFAALFDMLKLYGDITKENDFYHIAFDIPTQEIAEFKKFSAYFLKLIEKTRTQLIERKEMFTRESYLKGLEKRIDNFEKQDSEGEAE